ncbi:MAG: hypothetical protein AAF322_02245 [Pseudomonadota bacterium]
MNEYDYKAVAAPRRLKKRRGVRGTDALLAITIEETIQEQAAHGWDYVRADTFPVEDGGGFLSKATTEHCAVLIFRRHRSLVGAPAARGEPAYAAPQPPQAPPVVEPEARAPAVAALDEPPRRG